jgi:transketolase
LSEAPLAAIAARIRMRVVQMSGAASAPHVASALSCTDILVALYFAVARVAPDRAADPSRDRIILSKGHASAALYACLAERGFFPTSWLEEYAGDDSRLGEHPALGSVPGIECSTGSLGHGLGIATGLALAARLDGRRSQVFVVLSDGECNEGAVWEAAMWAASQRLNTIRAIVDANGLQAIGRTNEITALEPLAEKWRAFGWDVTETDGHDVDRLASILRQPGERPQAVIARTVKGKGISFMEDDLEWHYRPPSPDDVARAVKELSAQCATLSSVR